MTRETKLVALALVVAIVLASCSQPEQAEEGVSSGASPSFSGCEGPPELKPEIPADFKSSPSQANVNCFAWQQFIGLNWTADPASCAADKNVSASQFGAPNPAEPPQAMGQVVWQTYKIADHVFLPEAKAPGEWCPDSGSGAPVRTLKMPSKFAGNLPLDLREFGEASSGHPWLTAQNGRLTLYEVLINEDEFSYIKQNKLYDADVQRMVAENEGISLPDGTSGEYGDTGAIEMKAAWIELDDPSKYKDYLTTNASVTYPGERPREAVMGLVGLHIIHKTAKAAQMIWSTFEHVDNAPSEAESGNPPRQSYTYFDPNCDASTDYYKCKHNEVPAHDDPKDAPIQVVRKTSIPSEATNYVTGLNQAVWDLIGEKSPESVFLNYQLVNVLWPQDPNKVPAGYQIPLPDGNARPTEVDQPVANTTMETYVQDHYCLRCHQNAPIASATRTTLKVLSPADEPGVSPSPSPAESPIGSDYSFLFSRAQAGGSP